MRLLTVAEAAKQLNVSRGTIYNLCGTGELPHRRIGVGRGCIRFTDEDLREYLDRKKVKGQEGPAPAPKSQPVRLRHLELS
jgi:excisionase family DNA binding protein